MDELIEMIRAATATDVSDEARARGAEACRTLLSVLDAKPGESLVAQLPPPEVALAAPSTPSASPPNPQAAAQMIASALRGMKPDQLLDLAIARLRAALPAGTELAAPQPLKFHLVDIRR